MYSYLVEKSPKVDHRESSTAEERKPTSRTKDKDDDNDDDEDDDDWDKMYDDDGQCLDPDIDPQAMEEVIQISL